MKVVVSILFVIVVIAISVLCLWLIFYRDNRDDYPDIKDL